MAHDPVLCEDGIEYLTRPEGVLLTHAVSERGGQVSHDAGVHTPGRGQSLRCPGVFVGVQADRPHGPQCPTSDPQRVAAT
jgi:hypothetical protein